MMISLSQEPECVCANLRRANRAVTHLFDLVLAPTQLRVTQFILLRAIASAGEIAHYDLARQAFGSEETFSRRLASARKCGWISMRTGERQRRVYRLTEEGEQVLRTAGPYGERAQEQMRSQLGEPDWNALLLLTRRAAAAAIRAETAPRRNSRPDLSGTSPARVRGVSVLGACPARRPPQPEPAASA